MLLTRVVCACACMGTAQSAAKASRIPAAAQKPRRASARTAAPEQCPRAAPEGLRAPGRGASPARAPRESRGTNTLL